MKHRLPVTAGFAIALAAVFVLAMPAKATGSDDGPGIWRHTAGNFPERATRPPVDTPSVVIGGDDRTQIFDTDIFPFSSIAYLELYDGDEFLLGTCTGTFIGPDVLLTAAHCLYDVTTGEFTADIAVVPGKNGDDEPFGFEFAFDYWFPDEYISEGGSSDWDFGLVVMQDFFMGDMTGWLTVANLTDATLSRSDFFPTIVGYPGDKPDGTMWGDDEPAFTFVDPFLLYYTIDTAGGQSGSAIISTNLFEPFGGYVVGVHTTGGVDENLGSRIDEELLDLILGACDFGFCTIDHVTEPVLEAFWAWGDGDCSGDLPNPVDSLKTLRIDAGMEVVKADPTCPDLGFEAGVLPAGFVPRVWGDVDCSGLLDPIDSLKLLRFDAGLPVAKVDPTCPDVGQAVSVAAG